MDRDFLSHLYTMDKKQPLPLGRSTFSALRAKNEIYVDKTALVYQLARFDSKVFLARPRRVGKSLLVSTFESLFKDGLKYFKGLAIESLWTDKTYPVVRLDFSEIKEFTTSEQFQQKFNERLISKFKTFGFHFENSNESLMSQLSTWLSRQPVSCFVLLIDEYDAPLTACLNQPKLFNEIRSIMSEFFLTLKSNEGCLRFFFMTGITKFSSTSIFSAFNNLNDISLDTAYGTLLGYTEEELTTYFSDYLSEATHKLNLSPKQLLEQLRIHYDGFCFDRRAKTHVYCPWSILNFCQAPEEGLQNYWYTSGGQPTVLMKYLTNHSLEKPENYANGKYLKLSALDATRQFDDVSIDVLLTQAGYLSIKEVTEDGYVLLDYPNQEVAVSMAQLYADELLNGERLQQPGAPSIAKVLASATPQEVVELLNQVINAIDYHRFPITSEATCRAYIQVLLIGAALIPRVENHTALGRSDLEVGVGDRHWVFELKFAEKAEETERLLQSAVAQIKERRYGQTPYNQLLHRLALVFNAQTRRFEAWEEVV